MAMRRPRIKAAPNLSVMRARGATTTTATANVPPKTGLLPTRGLPLKSTPVLAPKSTVTPVLAPKSTVTPVLAPKSTVTPVLAPKPTAKPVLPPTSIAKPVLSTKSLDQIKPVLESSVIGQDNANATITKSDDDKVAINSEGSTIVQAASKEPVSAIEQPSTASKVTLIQEASIRPFKDQIALNSATMEIIKAAKEDLLTVSENHSAANKKATNSILTATNEAASSNLSASKEHSTDADKFLDASKAPFSVSNDLVAVSSEPLAVSNEPAVAPKKPLAASDEGSAASTQVSKLSTGQFVNGRYLATEKPVVKPKEISTAQPQKPIMRRFLGAKNKFKPNLFSRAQQMEVELNRVQKPGQLASLPEVNNPTRTRKYSSSGDEGAAGGRQRKNSNTSGGESTPPSKKTSAAENTTSAPKSNLHKPPKAVISQAPPLNATSTVEVNPSELDNSSLEFIDVSTGERLRPGAGEDAALTAKAARMATGSLLRQGRQPREIVDGKIVGSRRRSWSGSNSSGDELHRMSGNVKAGSGGKPPRRRTAESRTSVSDRTNFALKRRKIESKRRFSNGVPGRGTMTMFDLIYYNPDNGTEMRVEGEEEEKEAEEETGSPHGTLRGSPRSTPRGSPRKEAPVSPSKSDTITPNNNNIPADKQILDASADEEQDLPSVQVKVGANGEIIIDESSTMVETTASKRARTDLADSTLVVENAGNKLTNYGTYSKKRKYSDWSERETFRFYRALSLVGSDFSMMETLFKKRTRHELKLKFKKEERINGTLVDKCLRQRGQFTDLKSFIDEESDEDEMLDEKADRPTRGRRRQPTKSSRDRGRKISSRGMYESSSDGGEDADVETSRSPAANRRRGSGGGVSQQQPNQRRVNSVSGTPDNNLRLIGGSGGKRPLSSGVSEKRGTQTGDNSSSNKTTSFVSIGASPLQKLPGVKFPPALLAANPGLAQATPGSLVVVASPSKGDPSSQLLHVYMVSDKKPKQSQNSISTNAITPPAQTSDTATNTSSATQHQNLVVPSRQRDGTPTGGREGTPPAGRSRSPTPTRRSGSGDPGRYSIDPAVVRVVDRKRTIADSVREGIYKRQRTLSEGSMISPSKLKSLGKATTSKNNDSFEAEPYSRTRRFSGNTSICDTSLELNTSSLGDAIVSLANSKSSSTTPNQSETSSYMTSSSVSQSEDSNQLTSTVDQSEDSNQLSESNVGQSESGIIVARKSRPVLVSE